MRNNLRKTLRPLLVLCGLAPAAALNLSAQGSCSGREPVGWLGISGVSCTNCYFSYPGEGQPTLFATEPRITALASNSPAAPVLRRGDILVSIDNHLITTYAGGRRLSNLKPGESVEVVVRRNGELLTHRFANLPPICPYDARVLGSRVTGRGPAGGRGGSVAAAPSTAPPAVAVSPAASGRVFSAGLLPRVSFGFGITCSRCAPRMDDDSVIVWRFRERPEIYSVETQSQAARAGIRRGDVITHIDNVEITSEEGGRRFGQVTPGQVVKFRFQRGSTSSTRELRAEPRRGAQGLAVNSKSADLAETSLQAARQLVERIRVQESLTRDRIAQLREHRDERLQELAQQLMNQQSEQRRKLEQLYSELAQLEVTAPRLAPARVGAVGGNRPVPKPPSPDRNTSRYSGRIGETDIEVRGPVGVFVERTDDEVIIYVGDSTIRLKRSGNR